MAIDLSELESKVVSVFRADSTLVGFFANSRSIFVGPANKNSAYPCLSIQDIPEKSEPQIPARRGNLVITAWEDTSSEPPSPSVYATLKKISNRVLTLIDVPTGTPLNEPDGTKFTIRVVQIQRIHGPEIMYDRDIGRVKSIIVFDYTQSYREDWEVQGRGDAPWV